MRKFHFILRAISNFSRVQFFYVGHQLQLVNLHSRKRGQTVFWHPLNRINQANLAGQTHPIHPSWPGLRNPNAGSHILRRKFSLFALTREGGGEGVLPTLSLTWHLGISLSLSFTKIHSHTLFDLGKYVDASLQYNPSCLGCIVFQTHLPIYVYTITYLLDHNLSLHTIIPISLTHDFNLSYLSFSLSHKNIFYSIIHTHSHRYSPNSL